MGKSECLIPCALPRQGSKCVEETVVTTCAPDTIINGAVDGKNHLVGSGEVEVLVEAPGEDSGGKGSSNNVALHCTPSNKDILKSLCTEE